MPVSRPILLALIGAVLACATFYVSAATKSSDDGAAAPTLAKPTASKPSADKTQPARPDSAKSEATAPAKAKAAKSAPAAAKPAAAKPAPTPAAKPAKPAAPKINADLPPGVSRALAKGRTVVLFFYQRGSADDSATAKAVAGLRGRRGVAVFTAPISKLGDYRAVTGGLGVSQAPAVVIVGKDKQARVVEGYVDSETLAQEVADSR